MRVRLRGAATVRRHEHSPREPAEAGPVLHRQVRPLVLALGITLAVLVAELVGGALTNSLALLAAGGHMASDAAALALALSAIWLARRPYTPRRSYGYLRAEVLAALLNGVLLWGIVGYLFWEAAQRFGDVPTVRSGPMLGVAMAGLVANVASGALLARASRDNLNIRGAFIHVVGDAIGSVGGIVA